MLTVIIDGRRHDVVGRYEAIIRTLMDREDWARRDKMKITINAAGKESLVIHGEEIIDRSPST